MLNKLSGFLRRQNMLCPGETVYCAISGGADSVALLWAMYLLKEKLQIRLHAAHFNHHLRGEESDRDEAFAADLCSRYGIPLEIGHARVTVGEKGLEAAAREARYAFFDTLPGKVATAHTADDNTETVLMHLIRGTGLKGLGGIAPVRGKYIRPMLTVTRQEVLRFLEEYHLPHVTDSTNFSDDFLRNRLRSRVMPLLKQENPSISENVSAMALRLRLDEEALTPALPESEQLDIAGLRHMPEAIRSRTLAAFLQRCGVKEPSAAHIQGANSLVFSENPSARACFPGGIVIGRRYDRLCVQTEPVPIPATTLPCPGTVELPEYSLRITCRETDTIVNTPHCFTFQPVGELILRSRQSGDSIRLSGGSKSLKKLFSDKKIPAAQRPRIPVICDEAGIVGVGGIGVNLDRVCNSLPAVLVSIGYTDKER